jgi:hypothetical protein
MTSGNGPASVIVQAGHAAVREGNRISDPIERAAAFEDAIVNTRRLTAQLASARRDAIVDARRTWSAEDIAERLGVTQTRVYQILKTPDELDDSINVTRKRHRTGAS